MRNGQKVIRVINIMGIKTASIEEIEYVGKGVVQVVSSALEYDLNGMEINPVIPGCYSELIPLEE